MQTLIDRARTQSGKLREDVRRMIAGLVEEQQRNIKKTLEKLEEVMKRIETRVLEVESTIERLGEELSTERRGKEELRTIFGQIDEDSSEQDVRSSSTQEELIAVNSIPNALERDDNRSSLEIQENTCLHDRATSPAGELTQLTVGGKFAVEANFL